MNYFYGEYKLKGYYKTLPQTWTGPKVSDLSYTQGYGSLTSGHLDLTMSYKTFGTFG